MRLRVLGRAQGEAVGRRDVLVHHQALNDGRQRCRDAGKTLEGGVEGHARSVSSRSSAMFQPWPWSSSAFSLKNCSWVSVSMVPSLTGLRSMVTSHSRSGVLCHAHEKESFRLGTTSR